MRPKWIVGLAIGLFFLYVSYFGVAGIGLTLYPSRRTNLQAGMAWSTIEKDGASTRTYTVTSVVGSVVTVQEEGYDSYGGVTFPWSSQDIFDVRDTTRKDIDKAQVVASGLSIGDEVLEILNFGGGTTIHGYVDAIETLAGKTLLVSHVSTAYLQFTTKYFQDSGVEYSQTSVSPLGPSTRYQCTSGDPVTDVPTYTITASAGIGGSISPSGAVPVSLGLSQAFTISPNNGYTISSVLVDGSNQGAIASYTFTNVHAPHTISASFAQLPPEPTYNIIASAGAGGSISPSGTITVNAGASQTFTITSNTGYQISSVLIDGASTFFTVYTFTNVQASHTIAAFFSVLPPNQYTISASAGTGGSINPSGSVIVTVGASQSFTIASSAGYHISDVSVDGVSLSPPVLTYTFTNVQTSHTISASFSLNTPNQYTISASAGTGGSISPSGSVLVNQGLNQAFTITANNGYIISAVLVDGTSQGAVSTYTFTNVQTSHTISASFSVETGPTPNYFLLILLDLLGNSRLMLIVGASITSISAVMLFWPKHKPQYY